MDNNTKHSDNEENSRPIQCNTYVYIAPGSINIGNIENFYTCDLTPKEVSTADKKITPTAQPSEMKRAMRIVEEMALEGMFKIKKRYFGVYKIIEERFVPGMTTQNFCDIMEKISELLKEDLPQNDQIRRISCKKDSKYPNWEFSAPDDIKLGPIFTSYAKELLDRMGLK